MVEQDQTIPKPTPQLTEKERFPIEYKDAADNIRHYSTTRSALTSFLMTVGLTTLAYYFNFPAHPLFLPITGIVVLMAAVFVCLTFSYRTERNIIHLKALWKWAIGEERNYPKLERPSKVLLKRIYAEMWYDAMNVGLILVILVIILTFLVSAWQAT